MWSSAGLSEQVADIPILKMAQSKSALTTFVLIDV